MASSSNESLISTGLSPGNVGQPSANYMDGFGRCILRTRSYSITTHGDVSFRVKISRLARRLQDLSIQGKENYLSYEKMSVWPEVSRLNLGPYAVAFVISSLPDIAVDEVVHIQDTG